jgi:hypothetical protein
MLVFWVVTNWSTVIMVELLGVGWDGYLRLLYAALQHD